MSKEMVKKGIMMKWYVKGIIQNRNPLHGNRNVYSEGSELVYTE